MFKKAQKEQCKLRLAIFGASGSGKTYSALSIAHGLGKKIAVIDTEFNSASKYADRFEFDVCCLEKATIDNLIKLINQAKGYDVLIIDSLSHSWQELLEEIEKLTQTKYKGNSFRAWGEGTPKQRHLIQSILKYPGHLIATMRSKMEYAVSITDKGKAMPQRMGTAPEQGKNIEYEFDMLMNMEDSNGTILKDRTGKFHGQIIEKPDSVFGETLLNWLNDGLKPLDKNKKILLVQMIQAMSEGDINTSKLILQELSGVSSTNELTSEILDKAYDRAVIEYEKWKKSELEAKNNTDKEVEDFPTEEVKNETV